MKIDSNESFSVVGIFFESLVHGKIHSFGKFGQRLIHNKYVIY